MNTFPMEVHKWLEYFHIPLLSIVPGKDGSCPGCLEGGRHFDLLSLEIF